MIETYSGTVTEIDELGGAEHSVETSTVVCDVCGRAYPRDELLIVDGREICEDCVDEE